MLDRRPSGQGVVCKFSMRLAFNKLAGTALILSGHIRELFCGGEVEVCIKMSKVCGRDNAAGHGVGLSGLASPTPWHEVWEGNRNGAREIEKDKISP